MIVNSAFEEDAMKQTYFMTEVKSIPVGHATLGISTQPPTSDVKFGNGGNTSSRAWQPQISEQLRSNLNRAGAEVLQAWQVIGHEFDLVLFGSVPDPTVLSKIDAICKANGYEARTYLAFEAGEYAQEFAQTRRALEPAGAGSRS